MQDHIKRLAVEAGAVPTDDGLAFGLPELTAFAQAVARECAEFADNCCRRGDFAEGEDIRARFGLEG